VQCDYWDAGACRSCTLLDQPYVRQVSAKEQRCRALLPQAPEGAWLPTVTSPEAGFRNKAKMVVGGTVDAPLLGIVDGRGGVTDLRRCGLHQAGVRAALPVLARLVSTARLTPWDLATDRGELKHLLVTEAPSGELMVRFVLRSTEAVPRLRKALPALAAELPALAVATANLLPERRAVLEGSEEIVLTERSTLTMHVGEVALHLRPQSFFQTNTTIATALYAEAAAWVDELDPASAWDLYCGVGGFALHLARPGRRVVGVELSAEAIVSARLSAAEAGRDDVSFEVGDATAWATAQESVPDLVVVNPPRRGLGGVLAGWLDASGPPVVLYSSCDPVSLAADLAAMPAYEVRRVRVFDMFPQTAHLEVLTMLVRRDAPLP